ncbi:sigma-70 family RNA polymerase sigma factor [Thermohalobacter berrensis]|uniref:Uncharacterized protein n=1 Tax=Thermohalobacter berrensis TaxID=99594 RepID=A0A419T4D6_9FIRM|nr:sigma-70 family RNA polymerase sigma factor [Thermohalobacter berrensis]RKD32319.1 hypothetical protein BET03_03145 [Thermohalobacter berrensis]
MILRLKPLILSSIKRYYNKKDIYDDLIQEGYELILNGLENYDEKKGVHFLGYIKLLLKYHYLNKNKDNENTISLNMPINDEEDMELIDTIQSKSLNQEEIIVKREDNEILHSSFLKLTKRQRQVISLFYVNNLSIKEISKKLGISYRTVVNTKATAIKKLKKFLEKNSKKTSFYLYKG